MRGWTPFHQQPKTRKGNVYVGPKPTIIKDGKEVPNPNYVEGDEFKMSDKPMYEGHEPSTHLMAWGESEDEAGNKFYVAYPTLFQDTDEKSENYGMWSEGGFKDAKDREEVYQFDTAEEAEAFAAGSWKNKK